jgi:hypothetical protein
MSFTEDVINKVWMKGKAVAGNDPAVWRKDDCGAWMQRSQHGERGSKYGWEIDHISAGGSDAISNLRPLHWENNVAKSDGRLRCVVTSSGTTNVAK